MPPQGSLLTSTLTAAIAATHTSSPQSSGSVPNQLREQWSNPSDIFSLLLLVGGDVILKSLAQFHGQRLRPVAFSFGWVAYAFSALLAGVGRLKVMPDPDCPSLLIACNSGFRLENQSWLLGRLLRNYEHWPGYEESEGALSITVYEAISESEGSKRRIRQGKPNIDKIWMSGIAVSFLQHGIAAIPAGLYNEWEILLITACGTVLAYSSGFLQEWSQGMAARRNSKETFALLEGNGFKNAFVIKSNGIGLNLNDFAMSERMRGRPTIAISSLLLVLWTALLITVAGLKSNTWYIVAVGSIGMLQNTIVAGAPRSPGALGIHIKFEKRIHGRRVMDTLYELENDEPGIGQALLPVFFPGPLRPHEVGKWANLAESTETRKRKLLDLKRLRLLLTDI